MARIIGGIAASHTPTIGFAYDRNKRDDPIWAPIFENFAPLAAWLAEKRPDVLLLIYNDHVTSFFFDHYSAFALDPDGHCVQLYYYMEQVGWDGAVRPAAQRRAVNGAWPETLEPLSDTYIDQVFQGPLG